MANEIEKKEETRDLTLKPKTNAGLIVDYYLKEATTTAEIGSVEPAPGGEKAVINFMLKFIEDEGEDKVRNAPKSAINHICQFLLQTGLDINANQVFLDKHWNYDKGAFDYGVGIQGDGLDILVKNFGVDVKTIRGFWVIHEGDKYTLPKHDGIQVTAPTWEPTVEGFSGKPILVIYLIEKKDGSVDYLLSPRERVAENVMAQVLNNANRRKFEGKDAKERKREYLESVRKRLNGKTLEQLLSDESLVSDNLLNPSYTSPSGREGMIVRKMRKNALKHYTTDMNVMNLIANMDEDLDHISFKRNVVSEQNGEGKEDAPKQKIAAVSVSEEGEIVQVKEAEAKKPEQPKAEEPKKEETQKEPVKDENEPEAEIIQAEEENALETPQNASEGQSEPDDPYKNADEVL